MPILLIGEPGEIQQTLQQQLCSNSDVELSHCTFAQCLSCLDQMVGQGIDLVVVASQHASDAESVSHILGQPCLADRIPVVVLAREPSGRQVLQWLKLGASAVELWPCDVTRLNFLFDYLTVGRRSNRQPRAAEPPSPVAVRDNLVLASPTMQRLADQIRRVAPLDVNVLLSGETGVGKTRLARLLHDESQRRESPFCAVNCGALPEYLLESELFGHRKGAFTGADSNRKGRFEEVGAGTLFLDEVDSIPISSQCKLLRAIDNRVFEPLGCNRSLNFRGRIVAASNAQLEEMIERGEFRADLFYRLGVVDLFVPPLRDRREDIRPIAEATLQQYTARNSLSVRSISPQVIHLLESYDWPGNVRQLRNLIESSASLCGGDQIEVSDLSARWLAQVRRPNRLTSAAEASPPRCDVRPGSDEALSTTSLAESRAAMESDRICKVLREVGFNRTQAAARLGISRTMLYKKIAKYGLADAV